MKYICSMFHETEKEVYWELLGKEYLKLLRKKSLGQHVSLHGAWCDDGKTSTATAILPP